MKNRKMILLSFAALGLALGAPASQAADIEVRLGNISIDFGSVPQRLETVSWERTGYVQAPGYWRSEGRHQEWVPVRWIETRHGEVWATDRWTPARHHGHYQ